MHISRIAIQNFRNFAKLDAVLGPGVTCVVGANNTGKTNLTHALRLCIDANLASYHRQLVESDFHSGADPSAPTQVVIGLELEGFAGVEHEEAMVAAWAFEDGKARITFRYRPRKSIASLFLEGGDLPELSLEDYKWEIAVGGGDTDPLEVEWHANYGTSLRFEELQNFLVVTLPPLRDVNRQLQGTRQSPLRRLIRGAQISETDKQSLVEILEEANAKVAASSTIGDLASAIDESFGGAAGEAFKMDVDLGMGQASFDAISQNLQLLLTNRGLARFETRLNGLGLNNVLFSSMLVRFFEERIEQAKTPGQLLLFEEPEAHLHPQLQRVVLDSLMRKNFQTIATTHSTHVTSKLGLESVVVLTDDGSPTTASCVPSRNSALSDSEIQDLERYLDATRGTLLYARKVLLVEGVAELFLIPEMVKQVSGIDLDSLGITVIPIFGVHFPAYAHLFGPDGITKKCAIVADGDLTPSDATPDESEPDDDLPEFVPPQLDQLQNDYVKVFACETTFERDATLPGTVSMFEAASRELGAPKVADRLQALTPSASEAEPLEEARQIVLRTAKRFGKGRFAQVASKHTSGITELPPYIREAIDWLIDDSSQ